MSRIDQYLEAMLKKNASDLHFVSGDPIRARIHGELQVLVDQPLSADFAQEALYEIMDATTQRTFEKEEAADFAYEIEGVSRFRANAFRHLNGIGGMVGGGIFAVLGLSVDLAHGGAPVAFLIAGLVALLVIELVYLGTLQSRAVYAALIVTGLPLAVLLGWFVGSRVPGRDGTFPWSVLALAVVGTAMAFVLFTRQGNAAD